MIGRSKIIDKKKIAKKIFLLFLLIILFVVNVVIVTFEYQKNKKILEEYRNEEKQVEVVPNFGTSVSIINLYEAATPLLDDKATLLEVKLSEYVEDNNWEVKEGRIIHVMVPDENIEQVYFFCKLSIKEEIVLLTYDRVSGTVIAAKCEYSEEEVLNEVWEGISPSDRDIQE